MAEEIFGTPSGWVNSRNTLTRAHLRMVDGLPTLALIELDVLVSVDGLDEAGFADAIGKAEHGCAISRALAGGPEIRVRATRE